MGQLEERFFSQKQESTVKTTDETAKMICEILSAGIEKGNTILRWGRSSKYNFRFDKIYDKEA